MLNDKFISYLNKDFKVETNVINSSSYKTI